MSRMIECRSTTNGQEETWFLQEISETGNAIGPEFLPWEWGATFTVSSYEIHSGISIKNNSLPRLDFPMSALGATEIEIEYSNHDVKSSFDFIIQAKIEPNPLDKRTYEFFGTDKKIENFTLRISKSDHDFCRVTCIPGYSYETDFKKFHEEDTIEILMDCSPKTFNNVLKIFEKKDKIKITLWLRGVRCFYSRDQMGISTDLIKVLSDEKSHPVKFISGNEINIPRDGCVRDFSLSASNFLSVENSDQGISQIETKTTAASTEQLTNIVFPNNLDDGGAKIMKAINRTITPLWLLLIISIIALFTR